MPGLSILYAADAASAPTDDAWERAVRASPCDRDSESRTLFRDAHCAISATTYPGYPVQHHEEDGVVLCLEGHFYGRDPRRTVDELFDAAKTAPHGRDGLTAAIGARVCDWDGDFVVVVYAKASGRLCIVSDPAGRLPLYARASGATIMVTRDQRFAMDLGGLRTPDRLGIAQLLLFGFPLGATTLVEGLERLPRASTVTGDRDGVSFGTLPLTEMALEHKPRSALSIERNADDLASLLVQHTRDLAQATPQALLGLSGGLDSRAIAGALARGGVSFQAITFADASGYYEKEIDVAHAVADALGAPWRLFRMPHPRGDRLVRLLEMKLGLNTLAMAFALEFFDQLRTIHGDHATYWSGDGGDKVMPDHRPRLSARQRADVTTYIIEKNHAWPLEQVAHITGLGVAEIEASVRVLVERYPERRAEQKYVRFLLTERAHRWIAEGEDTNRHTFWTVAPFCAHAFVHAAMECPDAQKSGHRLYRLLMRRLSPALAGIVDVNLGVRFDSRAYTWNRRARELSRRFPRLQRLLRRGPSASVLQPGRSLAGEFLTRQAECSSAVRDFLSTSALRDVAANPGNVKPYAVECLLTATSAVERITNRRSTLNDYTSTIFE